MSETLLPPGDDKRLSVSVIIPTYNRAAFVADAVDSVLAQTRAPDEVLVIDDGSTDGTDRVLSRFGPPVRVIRQPNRGRSAARNAGLRAATCDAVIFLDSDDMLMPNCIDRCVEVLERHPEVGVVYTDAHLADRAGRTMALYSEALPGARPSGKVLGELARRNFLTISSMVRRSCLAGATFDESMDYCEDYDFWRQLAARCDFYYVNEPLMRYRFHEAMTVSTRLGETLQNELEVQRRIMQTPQFTGLSRREKARTLCGHGIKNAMLGRTNVARRCFARAIGTAPGYLGGYPLLLLSLLGTGVLQYAILKRRELAGNKLGTKAGPGVLVEKQRASQGRVLPSAAPRAVDTALSQGSPQSSCSC